MTTGKTIASTTQSFVGNVSANRSFIFPTRLELKFFLPTNFNGPRLIPLPYPAKLWDLTP